MNYRPSLTRLHPAAARLVTTCRSAPMACGMPGMLAGLIQFCAVLATCILACAFCTRAAAQPTAFTYQGRLETTNGPANGLYDFTFTLYATNIGGAALTAAVSNGVPVSNGLFTVEVDFLSAAWFNADERWLELTVRTNGGGELPVVLSPRQRINSSPYALRSFRAETANTVAWGGLTGLPAGFADGVDNDTTYLAGTGLSLLGGVFSLNTNLTHGLYWRLTGNGGTTAGINFLGTTDDEPLELKVDGGRALRLEPNAELGPNFIGGASSNYVAPGVVGATIGGGGALDYLGLGNVESNSVFSDFGTIGGGWSNVIRTAATSSTIGGGYGNVSTFPETTVGGGVGNQTTGTGATIGGGRNNRAGGDWGTVAGGSGNTAGGIQSAVAGGSGNEAFAWWSVIGGGFGNTADGTARYSVVAGGEENTVALEHATIGGGLQNTNVGYYSAIGGGRHNLIDTLADYSVIPGGRDNTVDADYALAAGRRAKVNHNGSFVWADDTDADFASTATKQFAVRANNGVMIQAGTTALDLRGGGRVRVAGADIGTSTPVFIHQATAANISANSTFINHPHCNNDPDAILLVTQNWNPGGSGGTYNDHPIGVWYYSLTGRWAIFNQDLATMPANAAFNVMIVKP